MALLPDKFLHKERVKRHQLAPIGQNTSACRNTAVDNDVIHSQGSNQARHGCSSSNTGGSRRAPEIKNQNWLCFQITLNGVPLSIEAEGITSLSPVYPIGSVRGSLEGVSLQSSFHVVTHLQ